MKILSDVWQRPGRYNTHFIWRIALLFLFTCFAHEGLLNAQPWNYDFGTGTGTANNGNSGSGNTGFFSGTPENGGTYRVRIGTQGGALVLANPGTSLGAGTEAQLSAATGGSSNKFTVYNWSNPSTVFRLKFKMRTTSSGAGAQAIHIGSGAGIYADNNGYTSYNISITTLLINYSGGAISSVQRRINGSFTDISSPGITKDTDHVIEFFANNAATSTSYTKGGSNSLNAQSWDMWVDGTKISPSGGWPTAGTWAAGNNIAGFGFFAESSASNAAILYLDDLEYSNSLAPPTSFTAAGTLTALSTTYGTASSNTSFTLEGNSLSAGVSVNPPVGFEVSTSSNFSTTIGTNGTPLVVGSSGTLASTTVYVRLRASATPGSYSGNIVCSTTGVPNQNIATAASTVNTKELTVIGAVADNKTFDATNTASIDFSGASLNGIVGSDDVSINASSAVASFSDANVGENKPITVSGVTLSGAQASRYTVAQPSGLTADITKADQVITFNPLPAKETNDDPFELNATASSGLSVSYSSSNTDVATVSGNIVTIVGEGSTTITASQAGNSNFNPAPDLDQVLVVTTATKQNQTISFGSLSAVTYGDASFDLTATASSGLSVSFSSSNPAVATVTGNTVNIIGAGSTNITATQDGDETYNPAIPVIRNLTVSTRLLTVTAASAESKTYDGNTDAVVSVSAFSNLINGDEVIVNATGTFSAAVAGNNIQVTPFFSLSGEDAPNYSVDQNISFSLSADIVVKPISISGASATNKSYNGNTSTTATGTLNGVISGDIVSIGGATLSSSNVGTNIPAVIFLTGADAGNYSLDATANVTASITPKALSISGASAASKTYDRSTAAIITGSLSGVVGDDDVSVNLSGTFADFNIGINKPVTSTSILLGNDVSNYTLTQPSGLTATISPKDLTLSGATAQNKVFDGTTVATITGTLSGIISPDVVTFSASGTFNDPNIGTGKPVTASISLSGANAGNYTLTPVTGLTADIIFGTCATDFVGTANWNFNTENISSTPISGLSISAVSQGNNNGITTLLSSTSASSGYTGASGGNNAGAAARTGALSTAVNGSAYFEFSLTPASYLAATVTDITFGSRSTSTGPQAFSIRSSIDNYATDLATGSLSNNSTWTFEEVSLASQPLGLGTAVTYRIYGHSGTGSASLNTANWRIDDLKLELSLSISPALSSAQSAQACSGTTFNYTPTSSSNNINIHWVRPTVNGISNAAIATPQSGSISETLVNTTANPIEVTYILTLASSNCFITEELKVSVNPAGGSLSIGQISGSAFQTCTGISNVDYSITPVAGATNYTWTTTGGITLANGQNTTQPSFNFPVGFSIGTIRVKASNACAQSTERVLTVRSTPAGTPGPISGITSGICGGSSGTYSIAPVSNTENYEWVILGIGATIDGSNTGTSVNINFGAGFSSALLQVRASNSCGSSGWRSVQISSGVDALGVPGSIQGPSQGCPLTTETYSIPAIQGATTYAWRTTAGISIANNGSNVASVSFPEGFMNGTLFVKAMNACGETREVSLSVSGLTRTPGAISGQSTFVCANNTKTYSIAPVTGAATYLWSATGDISLLSNNGTEATFEFGPSFVNGTIQVQAVNACGNSAIRGLAVKSNVPARPGNISGISAGLCAEGSTVYSIAPVNGASGYLWTFTGDLDVTEGQGNLSATYTAGSNFTTGQVIVQAQNICGNSAPRSFAVRSVPLQPGVLSGPGPDVDKGSNGLLFSINPVVSATSYIWTGTNGLMIAADNGTSASIDVPSDFNRGAVQVRAVNACGASAARGKSLRGIDPMPFMRSSAAVNAPEIKVYPNPASDKVIVQGNQIKEILLYDLKGQLLQAHKFQEAYQEEIRLDYPAGMYFIQVLGDGWNTQHKIILGQ
jgi:hypothetical protein